MIKKKILKISNSILSFQMNVIYSSVRRVEIRKEVIKRTEFVIGIIQQIILNHCETNLNADEMTALLQAIKCIESWLK